MATIHKKGVSAMSATSVIARRGGLAVLVAAGAVAFGCSAQAGIQLAAGEMRTVVGGCTGVGVAQQIWSCDLNGMPCSTDSECALCGD